MSTKKTSEVRFCIFTASDKILRCPEGWKSLSTEKSSFVEILDLHFLSLRQIRFYLETNHQRISTVMTMALPIQLFKVQIPVNFPNMR